MEQKTIGKLIAALRKANGMTQKDLAEKLNVSDKTVSRWEREEGVPDLSLIPVIAEIFDVSCDELLRGERRPPSQRAEVPEEPLTTVKGEKQRQRLLKVTLSQYQNRTHIAMGISVVGLLAALIGNLAFLKAVLGALLGAIFFVVSVVCQAVFLNRAFLSVEDAELEPAELSQFKRTVIRLAQQSIGLTTAFAGFTFPLVLVDAYVGLGADNMLLFGLAGAALFLLVYGVVLYFFNASLLKKGVYTLEEEEAAVYHHNHRLKKKCASVLVVLLVCTLIVHQAVTNLWGPWSIMSGTTFQDYDSFIAFMEEDVPYKPYYPQFYGDTAEEPVSPPTDYAAQGNEIPEEEALLRTLEDANGNVVCQYIQRNESVISMTYSPKEGTVLPITVHTQDDLQKAREMVSVLHMVFAAAGCVEIAGTLLVYFKKRAR